MVSINPIFFVVCEVGGYVMGERVKEVYVMGEICEKEVYVMRDMKKCLCNVGDMWERGLCHEGYEKMFMWWERGGTYHEPPAPETRFLPRTPFAGKPETRFLPQTYKLADYQQFI